MHCTESILFCTLSACCTLFGSHCLIVGFLILCLKFRHLHSWFQVIHAFVMPRDQETVSLAEMDVNVRTVGPSNVMPFGCHVCPDA
jgi:hypothetical protein